MKKKSTIKTLRLTLFMALCFAKLSGQTAAALNFDGTNDYINRAIVSSATTSITMEARVMWGGASAGNKIIMSNGTSTVNGYALFVPSGTSSVAVMCGASVYTTTYNLIPQFTLLSLVISPGPAGNLLRVYANGNQVYSGLTSAITTPTGSFTIGGNSSGTENFPGSIDEVRFWNRALCQAELTHRAACQPAGNEPDLIAYYNFNQGIASASNTTVTVLNDLSPSNFSCTLNNFALTGTTSNWVTPPGALSSFCAFAPSTLTISPTGTLNVCSGQTVNLSVAGSTSYTWNTSSTAATIVITPTAASTSYSVIGNNPSAPCYGMATKTVAVIPSPTVGAVSNASVICTGQTATLTANGANTYTWSTTATTTVIAVSPTVTISYTVTGSAANGCTNASVITQSVSLCTGIASLNGSASLISVYPNPGNGDITVSTDSEMSLFIINNLGQVIKNVSVNASNNYKVFVSDLANGIYFITSPDNKSIKQKIIVSK